MEEVSMMIYGLHKQNVFMLCFKNGNWSGEILGPSCIVYSKQSVLVAFLLISCIALYI